MTGLGDPPRGPLFEHDCDRCVFLGSMRLDKAWGDAYVCPQNTLPWPTVVWRWSNEGPDYDSGAWLVDEMPAPMRARALELEPRLARSPLRG